MTLLIRNKSAWMTSFTAVSAMTASVFFPTADGVQSLLASVTFLVLLPIAFIRFFLHRKLSEFGVSLGNATAGVGWMLFFLAAVFGIFFSLFRMTDVFAEVTVPLSVRVSFVSFLIYAALLAISFLIQEFFFRGFLLNAWRESIGAKALWAQWAASLVLPIIQPGGSLGVREALIAVFSWCAGWIAYRSRSIWYSFFFFLVSAILGITFALVFHPQ